MTCTSPRPNSPRFSPDSSNPFPWQPALSQLQHMDPRDLDAVIRRWVNSLHARILARREQRGQSLTYVGRSDCPSLNFPFALRITRREHRLQAHHVERFAGWLQRERIPAGILVTTGGLTPDAITAAASFGLPRIRVLSGPQWIEELSRAQVAVSEKRLPRWVVDLSRVRRWLRKPPHPPGS